MFYFRTWTFFIRVRFLYGQQLSGCFELLKIGQYEGVKFVETFQVKETSKDFTVGSGSVSK